MKTLNRFFICLLFLMLSVTAVSAGEAPDVFYQSATPPKYEAHITAADPSEEEVYQRMIALKSQYPEGMPFTNDDEYYSLDGRHAGAGCHAFALILSDAAFGSAPITEHNDQSKIRVGDILRINNNTHSVIVLEIHPDYFVIAEGNYNSSVHWGRELQRAGLVTDFIYTRYSNGEVSQPTPSPDVQPSTPINPAPQTPPASSETVNIYRLYNTQNGEHLYTTDANEVRTLASTGIWNDEGIGWKAPASGDPVYRLYNAQLQNHLYTTDVNEAYTLWLLAGWDVDNDGYPLFYSGGSVPIYRVYNRELRGLHHLTTDFNEYSVLPSAGWTQEGVALYAASAS